ncbi:ImmA/IrrE family metallo-endopeptidase [Massilia aquatica]|uniref:ImmA/IrrE family metallo-endopeptidase n=1 Tax=Massilia aquatica TaxID=2609000 RepID=A0ABX0MEC5_9BURK|nr:ImmA/IrrE family metallo-endopeptidase [Massilia aquatica]NHZ45038.1 ImmA/IrrE family metallo-endopeptidase [Massilia aquatica]
MDAIELARQHARRLHDEAVKRGSEPWRPYQFAVGIANELGITVETCAPGAAILDGARAAFDGEIPLIVHEKVGTQFEQAFLVAHEIGHAELGACAADSFFAEHAKRVFAAVDSDSLSRAKVE